MNEEKIILKIPYLFRRGLVRTGFEVGIGDLKYRHERILENSMVVTDKRIAIFHVPYKTFFYRSLFGGFKRIKSLFGRKRYENMLNFWLEDYSLNEILSQQKVNFSIPLENLQKIELKEKIMNTLHINILTKDGQTYKYRFLGKKDYLDSLKQVFHNYIKS